MTTYVLVHGSWHDGLLLNPVVRELQARGHDAHAPTVAGHGKDADTDVTHQDGVEYVVKYLIDHDIAEAVLVGHSFGGTIIARVSQVIPSRIARLVFWSGFVPRDGRSVSEEVATWAPAAENRTENPPSNHNEPEMVSYETWRSNFIQDASDDVARSTYELLSPEPSQPKFERLDLTTFFSGVHPVSYIELSDDRALPPGLDAPAMRRRLPHARVHQVEGSHEILFTNPARIAEAIIEAGRP